MSEQLCELCVKMVNNEKLKLLTGNFTDWFKIGNNFGETVQFENFVEREWL